SRTANTRKAKQCEGLYSYIRSARPQRMKHKDQILLTKYRLGLAGEPIISNLQTRASNALSTLSLSPFSASSAFSSSACRANISECRDASLCFAQLISDLVNLSQITAGPSFVS